MPTTYTFGSQVNQASFVEQAAVAVPTTTDGVNVLVAPRPADGTVTLLVKDNATLTDLTPITVGPNGYWSYTTEDIPIILASADGGSNWSPQYAREAMDAAVGTVVSLASLSSRVGTVENNETSFGTRLTNVENTVANGGGGGGGGGTGGYAGAAPGTILVWPTPDKVGQLLPRPTTRLDVIVDWNLDTPPPSGGGYLIPGVDRYTDTSP